MLFLPTPMRFVDVFLFEEDVEPTAASLARLGIFELEGEDAPDWSEAAPRWSELAEAHTADRDRADRLLEALDVERAPSVTTPRIPLGGPAESVRALLEEAEGEVQRWRERREEAARERERLEHLRELLRLLDPVDLPLEELRADGPLSWTVGAVPRASLTAEERGGVARIAPRGRRVWSLNVFASERDVERTVETLLWLEDVELSPAPRNGEGEETEWSQLAARLSESVERAAKLLEVLALERPAATFPGRLSPRREAEEVPEALADLEAPVRDWRERKRRAEKERAEVRERRDRALALEELDLPLEELRASRYLRWAAGSLPEAELGELELQLTDLSALIARVAEREGRVLVVLAAPDDSFDVALRAVTPFLEQVALPEELQGTPARAARELEERLGHIEQRLGDLEAERCRLARRLRPRLSALWRRARSARDIAAAVARAPRHRDVYRISARLPGDAVETARVALEEATGGRVEVEARDVSATGGGGAAPIEDTLFGIPFVCVPVAPLEEDRALVIAAAAREDAEVLERGTRALFMQPLELPEDERGVPSEVLPGIEARIQERDAELAALERERRELARSWGRRLVAVRRQAASGRRIALAITELPQQRGVYLLSGWVPAPAVDRLLAAVETATEGRADAALVEPTPGGRRRPPTRLNNPALLRPFEALVRTFGYPAYGELDPTPLVALSFILMYGMMFGDIGHGALVALLGLLLFRRAGGTASSIGAVLLASGSSAALFGLFYGSLFGREDLIAGLWLSPLGGILELLEFSIAGGAVLLTVGLSLGLVSHVRARRWGPALFGPSGAAGLWFYVALVGGGYAAYRGAISVPLWSAILAAPAALLLLREPLERLSSGQRPLLEGSIAAFSGRSFFELFSTLLVDFSSTLSFLRLGAFAIAHLALMRAVFALAEATGAIAGPVIVVLGTILVVAFEGFVVAIQTLRLEYYEFFGKFFGGQGRAFRPLRLAEGQS